MAAVTSSDTKDVRSTTSNVDIHDTTDDDMDGIDERTPINRRSTSSTSSNASAASSSSSSHHTPHASIPIGVEAAAPPSSQPDQLPNGNNNSNGNGNGDGGVDRRFRFRLPRELLTQDAAVHGVFRFFLGTFCLLVLIELAIAMSWLFITFWCWHLWSEYRHVSCIGHFDWWLMVMGILHCAELVHFSLKTAIQRGQQWANGEERRCNCVFLECLMTMLHFTMIICGAVWIYQTGQNDVTCASASPVFKFVWYYVTVFIAILSLLCCCTCCIAVRVLTDSSLLPPPSSSSSADAIRSRQRSDFAPLDT